MMPVVKRQTENPAPIRHPEHRIGDGIPMVEITHDAHLPGGRRDARKVHLVEGSFRRIAIRWLNFIEFNQHIHLLIADAVPSWKMVAST